MQLRATVQRVVSESALALPRIQKRPKADSRNRGRDTEKGVPRTGENYNFRVTMTDTRMTATQDRLRGLSRGHSYNQRRSKDTRGNAVDAHKSDRPSKLSQRLSYTAGSRFPGHQLTAIQDRFRGLPRGHSYNHRRSKDTRGNAVDTQKSDRLSKLSQRLSYTAGCYSPAGEEPEPAGS